MIRSRGERAVGGESSSFSLAYPYTTAFYESKSPILYTIAMQTPEHHYITPIKRIETPEDMAAFKRSRSYKEFYGFVLKLSEITKGKSKSDPITTSEVMHHQTPSRLTSHITAHREDATSTREDGRDDVGSPTDGSAHSLRKQGIQNLVQISRRRMIIIVPFRSDLPSQASIDLSRSVVSEELKDSAAELGPYLAGSIGNSTRIDYGTGHEASFATWMLCICKLGVVDVEKDGLALVLRVFDR